MYVCVCVCRTSRQNKLSVDGIYRNGVYVMKLDIVYFVFATCYIIILLTVFMYCCVVLVGLVFRLMYRIVCWGTKSFVSIAWTLLWFQT